MRGNVLTSGLLAVVVVAASGHAERLYDQDGIRRHGTLRLVGRNAATCNVLAAQHPEEVYEQMRANQDQPLHLWQVDLSVTNGSGRVLTYLRASVDIDSEWPPVYQLGGLLRLLSPRRALDRLRVVGAAPPRHASGRGGARDPIPGGLSRPAAHGRALEDRLHLRGGGGGGDTGRAGA